MFHTQSISQTESLATYSEVSHTDPDNPYNAFMPIEALHTVLVSQSALFTISMILQMPPVSCEVP